MPDLVSILIPMRNAEAYIREAVDSVRNQHDVDMEIIVIDDGSTDRSAEMVRSIGDPRITLIAGPEKGISEALNTGLDHARGKYIARCDADDKFAPDRLADQLQFLKWNDDFVGVCGAFMTLDYQGRTITAMNCGEQEVDITDELLNGSSRTHLCTWLIRRSAIDSAGQFRSWFVTAEDIDLQLRLANLGRVMFQPAVRYFYRIHDSSITHQQPDDTRAFYERCAKEFSAQRRSNGQDALQTGFPPAPPTGATTRRKADDHIWRMLQRQAWLEHKAGHRGRALSAGWRLCSLRPLKFGSWKNMLLLLVKP